VRILFLSQRLPYAPNRGDRVRAYHLLEELRSWATVDVLSLVHDDEEAAHVGDFEGRVASVTAVRVPRARNLVRGALALGGRVPLTHMLLDAPGLEARVTDLARRTQPDLVFAFCSSMARLALIPALSAIPLVHDMVDVDSAKWATLAARGRFPRSWLYRRESRLLAAFETAISMHAKLTLLTTQEELESLERLAPEARIVVVQNGVDIEYFSRPTGLKASQEPEVVFCGVMNYQPNAEAAVWLAKDVWPLVQRELPAAQLKIVGSDPAPEVTALDSRDRGIEVTGAVPDVRPYLWRAAVAAAPLKVARGIQNKVLEAVAAGLPTVVTSKVSTGLPPEVKGACAVADEPAAFASAVCHLLKLNAAARRDMVSGADLSNLRWSKRLAPLEDLISHIS